MEHEVLRKYERMFKGFDLAFDRLLLASARRQEAADALNPTFSSQAMVPTGAVRGISKAALQAFFAAYDSRSDPEFVSRLFDVWDVDTRGVLLREDFRRLLVSFARLRVERIRGARPAAASSSPRRARGLLGEASARFLTIVSPREQYPRGSFDRPGVVEMGTAVAALPSATLFAARMTAAAAARGRDSKQRTFSMARAVSVADDASGELDEIFEMPPPSALPSGGARRSAPGAASAPSSSTGEKTPHGASLVVPNPLAIAASAAQTPALRSTPATSPTAPQIADWGVGGRSSASAPRSPDVELTSSALVQAVTRSDAVGVSAAGGQTYPPGISPTGWRAWGIRVMCLTPVTLLFDAVVLLNTIAILVELSLATDGPEQPYGSVVAAMVIVQYAMLLAFIVSVASLLRTWTYYHSPSSIADRRLKWSSSWYSGGPWGTGASLRCTAWTFSSWSLPLSGRRWSSQML